MTHFLMIALTAAAITSANATGTWSGTLTPADRDPGPAHLVLKEEGGTVTGTAGPNEGEQHPIQNGKAENGTLTFELESGGGLMTFTLKQEGDEIAGDITRKHEGQTQTAKLAVKRKK